MQSMSKSTLAYQLGCRPATIRRSIASVSVPSVVSRLNFYMGQEHTAAFGGDKVDKKVGESERDAVIFYMMNHALSVVRQRVSPLEDLGPYLPLVNEYHRQLAQRSARMFYYLLLICTRESRHCKSHYDGGMWSKLMNLYGTEARAFHETIKGKGSSGAVDIFRGSPPGMLLGAYTSFLSDLFHQGSFSPGYGGPAWGAVADVLRDFVIGKLSAEMMLDTSFTLAHNNGPIFNKGMLFAGFSNQELLKILDVQRSGQVPQLVASNASKWSQDPQVKELHELCEKTLGDCMRGTVDWIQVRDLGAVGNYHSQIMEQKKANPELAAKPNEPAKKSPQPKGPELASAPEQPEADSMFTGKFMQVMPGLKVKIMKVRP